MDISSLIPAGLRGGKSDRDEISPGYNKLSENLRRITPQAIQCAIFCGGSRCKYENPKAWPPVHMAIRNIFSHWVTDDILAMARPNTAHIIEKNIIAQFQGWNIKTIINLQTPGEHASCGGPLEESGFTYDPNIFMKNGIYFYNFAWKDYGDATIGKLLDMVKVVAFAVQEGRVAIHCHAGLGRTGVLIACYLIYTLRVRASDAIRFVRLKRPSAIQTRGQILCVQAFEHQVLPQMIVYHMTSSIASRKPCSLQTYLKKQDNMLHGYEQRTFKYIPKIVFVICERILQLCDCQDDNSPCEIEYKVSNISFTHKFISYALQKVSEQDGISHSYSWAESLTNSYYDFSTSSKASSSSQGSTRENSEQLKRLNDVSCLSPEASSCDSSFPGLDDICVDDVLADGIHGQELYENECYKEIQSHISLRNAAAKDTFEPLSIETVVQAFIRDETKLPDEKKKKIQNYQVDLNNRYTAWQKLELETDVDVLVALLFEWLETLKYPVFNTNNLSHVVIWSSKVQRCLEKLEPCERYLVEYLLRFLSRLRPMSSEDQSFVTQRLMAALTHQSVWIKDSLRPSNKRFPKLRSGTAGKLNEFFIRLMNLIEEANTQQRDRLLRTSKWTLISQQLHNVTHIPE